MEFYHRCPHRNQEYPLKFCLARWNPAGPDPIIQKRCANSLIAVDKGLVQFINQVVFKVFEFALSLRHFF